MSNNANNGPRDIEQYHRSVNDEFDNLKNRVRLLIGDKHWLSDGEYKESILRRILRDRLPAECSIARGFVYFPALDEVSTQIDILIHKSTHPVLFRDGDFVIVTPDAVASVIEVKTKFDDLTKIEKALEKLSKVVLGIRNYTNSNKCKAGLFVIDDEFVVSHKDKVLEALQEVASRRCNNNNNNNTYETLYRAIDWLSFGPNIFIKFWESPKQEDTNAPGYPLWNLYHLEGLARSYFIGNAVFENSPLSDLLSQYAWFPIQGGKQQYREMRIPLRKTDGGLERINTGGNP